MRDYRVTVIVKQFPKLQMYTRLQAEDQSDAHIKAVKKAFDFWNSDPELHALLNHIYAKYGQVHPFVMFYTNE